MKIVSLLPAATEIVCALGLRDQLVGRSHECDFPADVASLPALTRSRIDSSLPSGQVDLEVRRIFEGGLPLYLLDEARLSSLAPDVVVTQEACDVCAISYDQVVASLKRATCAARVVSLRPSRLGDILEDVLTVAAACGVQERGEIFVTALKARLAEVSRTPLASPPRVAVIEWLDPPMLAGHWVPEALTLAGAFPVGPEPGERSPYAGWEEIRALRPDAAVVAPCGFDLARTLEEAAHHAEALRSLAPRVLFMDGNAYLNRPGPRMIDAVETLAGWFRNEPVARERGLPFETVF